MTMNEILNEIFKHPKHKEFFKKHGYVKYSGASMKHMNIEKKTTYMLPVGMTEDELSDVFNQWRKEIK